MAVFEGKSKGPHPVGRLVSLSTSKSITNPTSGAKANVAEVVAQISPVSFCMFFVRTGPR